MAGLLEEPQCPAGNQLQEAGLHRTSESLLLGLEGTA